jgi:hypothetical protein
MPTSDPVQRSPLTPSSPYVPDELVIRPMMGVAIGCVVVGVVLGALRFVVSFPKIAWTTHVIALGLAGFCWLFAFLLSAPIRLIRCNRASSRPDTR